MLPYACGAWFAAEEVAVDGLRALARLLVELEAEPYYFVIRARLKGEARDGRMVRRRKLGEGAPFEPAARRWCALDHDVVVVDDPTDVRATAAAAVALLPEPFRRAAHHAALTASAGLKPEGRIRLWFWLSRPVSGRELKDWLRGVQVDTSTCEDVTPVYTAAPVITGGAADPLAGKRRSVTVWCSVDFGDLAELVEVPDELAPPEPVGTRARPQPGARPRPGSSTAVFGQKVTIPPIIRPDDARRYQMTQLRRLQSAPYGEGRSSLTTCAIKLYRLAQGGLLDPEQATTMLQRIMIERGWDPDEAKRGNTMCDVNRQLDWCWDFAPAVEVRP